MFEHFLRRRRIRPLPSVALPERSRPARGHLRLAHDAGRQILAHEVANAKYLTTGLVDGLMQLDAPDVDTIMPYPRTDADAEAEIRAAAVPDEAWQRFRLPDNVVSLRQHRH